MSYNHPNYDNCNVYGLQQPAVSHCETAAVHDTSNWWKSQVDRKNDSWDWNSFRSPNKVSRFSITDSIMLPPPVIAVQALQNILMELLCEGASHTYEPDRKLQTQLIYSQLTGHATYEWVMYLFWQGPFHSLKRGPSRPLSRLFIGVVKTLVLSIILRRIITEVFAKFLHRFKQGLLTLEVTSSQARVYSPRDARRALWIQLSSTPYAQRKYHAPPRYQLIAHTLLCFVVDIDPADDLLPILQDVNAQQTFSAPPSDLIQIWEDLRFISELTLPFSARDPSDQYDNTRSKMLSQNPQTLYSAYSMSLECHDSPQIPRVPPGFSVFDDKRWYQLNRDWFWGNGARPLGLLVMSSRSQPSHIPRMSR
ncbi:hypothetical protein K438DRAFT_1756104 [Mycena galopus ATCC 62051]|nr:hypothetical protein K438DRAFT_1756104 [Mycena galopus ATCC 62051]